MNKNQSKKKGMKILRTVLLLWTVVSIILAGILDIKNVNYILLGILIIIVIICYFIDKYIEAKTSK